MNLASRVEIVARAPHVEDLIVEPLVEISLLSTEPRSVRRIDARVKLDLKLSELPFDEATTTNFDLLGIQAAQARVWEKVDFLLFFSNAFEM